MKRDYGIGGRLHKLAAKEQKPLASRVWMYRRKLAVGERLRPGGRVPDQEWSDEDYDRQHNELNRYFALYGRSYTQPGAIVEWVEDTAQDQPGLLRILESMQQGDLVLIASLFFLSTSASKIQDIRAAAQDKGVRLIGLQQEDRLASAIADGLLEIEAEYEAELRPAIEAEIRAKIAKERGE